MTADELRKILDRFHEALQAASAWACDRSRGPDDQPDCFKVLDQVWRDLNNHCALMKDVVRALDTAIEPPRLLRMSLPSVNAEAIRKLQARVTQLEGRVTGGLISPIPTCDRCGRLAKYFCEVCQEGLCEQHAGFHSTPVRVGGCRGSRATEPDLAVLADGSVPE